MSETNVVLTHAKCPVCRESVFVWQGIFTDEEGNYLTPDTATPDDLLLINHMNKGEICDGSGKPGLDPY